VLPLARNHNGMLELDKVHTYQLRFKVRPIQLASVQSREAAAASPCPAVPGSSAVVHSAL